MLKTETRIFIFSYAYATMKQKVTLKVFSAFKGEYPSLLSEINFNKGIGETEGRSPKMHSCGKVMLVKEYNTLRDILRTSLLLQKLRDGK